MHGKIAKLLIIAVALLGFTSVASAAPVFDCPSGFAYSGACGVYDPWNGLGAPSGSQTFQLVGGPSGAIPALNGSQVELLPTGIFHSAIAMNYYQAPVDVQAFTTTFTFVPDGQNISFVLNNSNDNPFGLDGAGFVSGAGAEAGFYQGYSQPNPPPDNVFALEFDSYSALTNIPESDPAGFTYSSVQIYQSDVPGQAPYVECPTEGTGPNAGLGLCVIAKDKLSTFPVALNNPANVQNTTTGDLYQAVVTYDGSNFTVNLSDVTHPGPTYSHTWTGIDIPASVGASLPGGRSDTAYVGLMGAINGTPTSLPLYVNSWSFSEGAIPKPTPTPTATPTATSTSKPTLTPTATPTPKVCAIVRVSRSSLNFGTVKVGRSKVKGVTLVNTATNQGCGTVTFNGGSVSGSSEFSGSASCDGQIGPKGKCSVVVSFAPTSPGPASATATINGNASNSPQTIGVTGVGR